MTVEIYWGKVTLSDETQVVLGKDRKVDIWRKDNEKLLSRCLGVRIDSYKEITSQTD